MGFIGGMIYEQHLIIQEVGTALSYANMKVDINFNETKLVDEINTRVIPKFQEMFNNTNLLKMNQTEECN